MFVLPNQDPIIKTLTAVIDDRKGEYIFFPFGFWVVFTPWCAKKREKMCFSLQVSLPCSIWVSSMRILSQSEYEKALLWLQYQIHWPPDNKRDPPEEIYSHYFIWHGGRTACIIHASSNILLTSVKDIWTGIHLDKIGQSQPPNWTYAKCRGGVQCWIMRRSAARCSESEMYAQRA